jgi:hypothetical protein
MTPPEQRSFFRLAADWLMCQRILMDGPGHAFKGQTYSPVEWMTGQLATGVEMHLELKEIRKRLRP